MKGGYQILDLTGATAGSPVEVKGIYKAAAGNNGKPVMILTNDGQRVYAEIAEDDGDFITCYISAEGKTINITIKSDDSVTTVISDPGASITGLEQAVNELNGKTIGTWVNIPAQTVSTEISIYGSDQFRASGYIVRGGLCFVNLAIHVNIDIGNNSIVVLPDGVLPKPLIPDKIQATFKPPAWSSYAEPNDQLFAESLYQGNVLFIRKAVAEDYAISFVYPVANP